MNDSFTFLCVSMKEGDSVELSDGVTVEYRQRKGRGVRLIFKIPKTMKATRIVAPRKTIVLDRSRSNPQNLKDEDSEARAEHLDLLQE